MNYFVHESSIVDDGAIIGDGTKIWHFSHILSGAVIGKDCSFGQNTMVADSVEIGDNVKVQNNVSIYAGTKVSNDVFLGPSCVLTNVSNPRSQVSRRSVYEETFIGRGATIGANATVVCGVRIGRYAFVAAGAVVTCDVPDYGFIRGVPGALVGWMSRHGHPLVFGDDDIATCPESKLRYRRKESSVQCIDLDEEEKLPENLREGRESYRSFK